MNPLTFLSFLTTNIDAVFDAYSSIFPQSQSKPFFSTPTIMIQVKIFDFKKSYFSTWLSNLFKTFVMCKGASKIGQRCVDSPSERLMFFPIIEL